MILTTIYPANEIRPEATSPGPSTLLPWERLRSACCGGVTADARHRREHTCRAALDALGNGGTE